MELVDVLRVEVKAGLLYLRLFLCHLATQQVVVERVHSMLLYLLQYLVLDALFLV